MKPSNENIFGGLTMGDCHFKASIFMEMQHSTTSGICSRSPFKEISTHGVTLFHPETCYKSMSFC